MTVGLLFKGYIFEIQNVNPSTMKHFYAVQPAKNLATAPIRYITAGSHVQHVKRMRTAMNDNFHKIHHHLLQLDHYKRNTATVLNNASMQCGNSTWRTSQLKNLIEIRKNNATSPQKTFKINNQGYAANDFSQELDLLSKLVRFSPEICNNTQRKREKNFL